MEKSIVLKDKKISYYLRRYRQSKCLRIIIRSDGRLVVTAPKKLPLGMLEQYLLQKAEWILEKLKIVKKKTLYHFLSKRNRKEYLEHKEKARKFVEDKIKKYNQIYQFPYKKISIRDQRTRWGSCSQLGNLNFNYKIIFLPERSAEYIIAHELCHLKEFNHSKRFWDLVAKVIPEYREIRREIRMM